MKKKVLCNSLNIDYKFQHIKSGHVAFREAADPTLILFKGRYYLLASMSAGFWYSDYLVNWNFHENRNLPIYDYAPDVRQIGDYMYFCASRIHKPSTIYRTRDPFDEDGIMFCNQNFADYPMEIPEGRFDPWSIEPRWMLLSYKKPVTCSSYVGGHPAYYAVDENVKTWWCAAGKDSGEFLAVDLEKVQDVYAIQVNFAEEGVPAKSYPKDEYIYRKVIDTNPGFTRYLLEGSIDGEKWEVLADKREAETDLSHDLVVLDEKKPLRFVRVTGFGMPLGQRMAISGLRVFGIGQGKKPGKAEVTMAVFKGNMDVLVRWKKVPGAIGYNVRYGIAPEKLYHSWLVYEQNKLTLTTIVAGKDYYICVDSFNEAGITKGDVVKVSQK